MVALFTAQSAALEQLQPQLDQLPARYVQQTRVSTMLTAAPLLPVLSFAELVLMDSFRAETPSIVQHVLLVPYQMDKELLVAVLLVQLGKGFIQGAVHYPTAYKNVATVQLVTVTVLLSARLLVSHVR